MITKLNLIKLFAIASILALTTNFPSGFTNSSINTAVAELNRFINESYSNRGLNISDLGYSMIKSATLNCWFVSQIFGAIFAPLLTDRFGRKVGYLIAGSVMLLASAMQYVSTLFSLPEMLIAGRAICAFFSPLSDASLIMYLQECTPLEMRGTFSFLCETGYGLMCLLGMVLGMRVVLGHSLSQLLAVSIFPQIVFVSFLFFIPETPKYLMITKNDRAKALKSLEFFQGVKKENEVLLDEYIREGEIEGETKQSSIKEVLTTWHLRQAVILASMVLALSLPFYPVLQSSTLFFTKANIKSELAEISSTVLMVSLTVSSMIGTTFVDRFPRRALLFIFGGIGTTFLLLFVITTSLCSYTSWMKYAALGTMFLYMATYAMVVGPMTWFIGPELVPQRHRSTVFCFCFGFCNVLIAITNFVSVAFYEKAGALTFIPLYIIPSYICLVYLYMYLPETRNRETHEVVASNVTITNEYETFVRSAILNCWFVGQIFGALMAPVVTDNYGRKIAYIVSALVMLFATALQYVSSILLLPELLIVGRLLAALGTPLSDAALVLYLQESTPINLRGSLCFLCDIGYSLMCLLGMILGMRSIFGDSFQLLLAISVIPQLFFVIFLFFIPETPKYLMITKKCRDKALKSLEFFQGVQSKNEDILNQYAEQVDNTAVKVIEIFLTQYLRRALILATMILVQTLAFYPVLQSSTYFFENANVQSSVAELSSTVLMILYSGSTILGTPLIDRFSHRNLLLIFGITANIALFTFAIASVLSNTVSFMRFVCLIAIGIYIISYGTILGPMSWFIGPALVPQHHRARILCYAHVISEIMISCTNFLSVYFYTRFSAAIFVPLFIVPSTVSIIYIYVYLPETRNRDTDVIVKELQLKKHTHGTVLDSK
uniref:MFS domain-containing protein n=1 Tax=Syphacia muris TaxID=451379 RepID=A0A0N5AUY0_9BILA